MNYDPNQDNELKESFVEYQDSMVKDLKGIARISQDMVSEFAFEMISERQITLRKVHEFFLEIFKIFRDFQRFLAHKNRIAIP